MPQKNHECGGGGERIRKKDRKKKDLGKKTPEKRPIFFFFFRSFFRYSKSLSGWRSFFRPSIFQAIFFPAVTFLVLVNFIYSWHLPYFSASSQILSILITYQNFWRVHTSSWISTNSFFFIYLPAFGLSFQLTEFVLVANFLLYL